MKNFVKILSLLVLLGVLTSCNNSPKANVSGDDSSSNTAEQSQIGNTNKNQETTTKVILKADGKTYSIEKMNNKRSYLQFYTEESDMKQDGNLRIESEDESESLTVVIDGFNAKGKDLISGSTNIQSNNTTILYKKGLLEIHFMNGELNVSEVSKDSGKVKLTAKGTCTIKEGESYTDMKLDIEGELEVEAQISDVKTLNFKKTK